MTCAESESICTPTSGTGATTSWRAPVPPDGAMTCAQNGAVLDAHVWHRGHGQLAGSNGSVRLYLRAACADRVAGRRSSFSAGGITT